ncbi:MAG: DNA-binding beta-propeller fold protein YncE [Chloroflexi bacterium]|nr:MAG: DNA-binding beta-propeller fold protein YncE [Chloroflexota bacterium]
MRTIRIVCLGVSLLAALILAACSTPAPASAPEPEAPAQTTAPIVTAKLLAFSNSKPHVTLIDAETNSPIKTADIPNFTKWTWNDDNNYFDGKNVWLGIKYPEADDAQVIALDVNTLEVTSRIPVGKEKKNIYIGKSAKSGALHVGKQGSREIVVIDTNKHVVVDTWTNMPAGAENVGVVCDADIAIGSDGIERFFYPTQNGDSVVSVHAVTGEVLKETKTPKGSKPLMHTNDAQGRMWVQEVGSHTNSVFDPVTLDLIKRFPAAQKPVVATFSPDGKYAYIGHSGDPVVQVVDTTSFKEVTRVTVGNTPTKIAVHPNGRFVYAIASKEANIAVFETETWNVIGRIPLYNNPGGLFLWSEK